MQLYTAHNFTVVRQLQDPSTSANTYYVQAVIRNAYTDAIIDTLKLDNKGSQRFKKDWKVPADPSGEGFYISIVTSVYSDSIYSTKSSDYGDEENTYLVVDKFPNGRGGYSGPSEGSIRKIIQEEITKAFPEDDEEEKKARETVETPELPDRWDEVLQAIKTIEPCQPTSLSSLVTALESISNQISGIEIPPVDFTPILDVLKAHDEEDDIDEMELKDTLLAAIEGMKKTIDQAITNTNLENQAAIVKERIAELKRKEDEEKAEKETAPVDISKLST